MLQGHQNISVVLFWTSLHYVFILQGHRIPWNISAVCIRDISSPVAQCVARRAPMQQCAYGGWFPPRPRHSVRMTYRPSAALRLLGSLRISHNKFLRTNKWILILILILIYVYCINVKRPSLRYIYICMFQGADYGDVSKQKELRKRLKCKSFKWFLDNVYPEKEIMDENVIAHGKASINHHLQFIVYLVILQFKCGQVLG